MKRKLSMKVSSLKKEMQQIELAHTRERNSQLLRETSRMVQDLKSNTPVLTGAARDGWSFRSVGNNKVMVRNSVEYIQALNHGHSRQAPAFFIESTAIKYGRPSGLIVETDN